MVSYKKAASVGWPFAGLPGGGLANRKGMDGMEKLFLQLRVDEGDDFR